MNNDNLKIWNHSCKIDPDYIKPDSNGGYNSFSLNGYWMIREATKLWGPIGVKWGYEIIEERYDQGATIWHLESLKTPTPVSLGHVVTHTVKISLWFPGIDYKEKGVVNFGHTPFIYATNNGTKIKTDGEAPKKSLTDALKKCLSFVGIAGDVYLGEYDNAENLHAVKTEFEIEKAEDKDSEIDKKVKEIIDYVENQKTIINDASIVNEVAGILKTSLRYLNRNSKITGLEKVCSRGVKTIENLSTVKKEQLAVKK